MKTKEENIIAAKSYAFAVRCVKLYKYLCDEKNDYSIGRQLMRSGTSIGANVKEATRGISKADCQELLKLLMSIVKQVNNNYALCIINYALKL